MFSFIDDWRLLIFPICLFLCSHHFFSLRIAFGWSFLISEMVVYGLTMWILLQINKECVFRFYFTNEAKLSQNFIEYCKTILPIIQQSIIQIDWFITHHHVLRLNIVLVVVIYTLLRQTNDSFANNTVMGKNISYFDSINFMCIILAYKYKRGKSLTTRSPGIIHNKTKFSI